MSAKLKGWILFFYLIFNSLIVNATIKVGTLLYYPPFVLSPSQGFDIDIIQNICQRLNEKCELVPMQYQFLFTSLESQKIDIAIGCISISEKKLQHFIFSLPYMISKGEFMILKSNLANSPDDFKGMKVGVVKGQEEGGVFYDYLKENFEGQFEIVQFNDLEELISKLRDQSIVAAFIHKGSVDYWEENGGDQFKALGGPFTVGVGIGIMALPKEAALIQRINLQLRAMERDNTYVTIYSTYFKDNWSTENID